MLPLWANFPKDKNTFKTEDSFMIGTYGNTSEIRREERLPSRQWPARLSGHGSRSQSSDGLLSGREHGLVRYPDIRSTQRFDIRRDQRRHGIGNGVRWEEREKSVTTRVTLDSCVSTRRCDHSSTITKTTCIDVGHSRSDHAGGHSRSKCKIDTTCGIIYCSCSE